MAATDREGGLFGNEKSHLLSQMAFLAEKERFELSNRFTGYTISNRAPSTN